MRRALLGLILLGSASEARAEGEATPMFGGGIIATSGPDETEIAGVELELAIWRGRFGLALEGSRQWSVDGDGPRVAAVGASLRLLAIEALMPSLLEPRDVELGIELQSIIERAWWQDSDRERAPISYGLGLAVRLRGGGDDYSNLLAESRLYIRAMTSPRSTPTTVARDAMGPLERVEGFSLMIGLGALWGRGESRYVSKFDPRPLDALNPR